MPTASTCSSILPDIALSRSALVICLEFTLQKTLTGRSSLGTSAISGIAGISRFPSGFETTFTCVSYSLLRAANRSGACIPPRSSHFGCATEVRVGVRERDSGLRHPDKFARLLRRDRKLQRFGVSKANVFTCENHNPPRYETEIFPGVQHFRQQVHRTLFI